MKKTQNVSKKPHDSAYKYLFKNKRIFLQLLKSFVEEDFIECIELDSLELIDKSMISDDLLDRESDLIYKINYDDKEYFIYILIEFQSTVDKTIPVRMFGYILMLYDLIYKNSRKGLLPNVFPIMLYNGKEDWDIPLNLNELIEKNIPTKYIPSFEYYPLIEKDIPDENLERLHNLVAAVVYLEKQNDETRINEAIEKVIGFVKDEDIIDIRMFAVWLKNMFRADITDEQIGKITNIKEAKSMLTVLAERIEKKGKIEGKLEGKIEGKLEGKIENAKKMLVKGYSIEDIADITGLSIEQIEKLKS